GPFDAFFADISLGMLSTEFEFALGDWNGPGKLEFFDAGGSLGTFTTTTNFSSAGNTIIVASTIPFNRVTVDASTTGGNFVIPVLGVQIPEPGALTLLALGALALLRRR
ncbi:MAG: PEP-CTERM sorting domain-containing protein, partial [Planctomycetes bacterium]|nr:PEP-CTERM sorting domain-containing protein [Planctomycetota bacterium]